MRTRYPLNDDPQLELCLTGKCGCVGQCKFKRCKNCDSRVGDDGKTLEDWCGYGEIHEDRICSDCGAVLDPS